MGTITLTGYRGYQDIGTVGQTIAQLAGNVQSINQILDVGLRNTKDYIHGFVRVEDLIGLGLATLINGNQLQSSGAGGGGTTFTAIDSISLSSGNLSLVNDNATPGNDMFYGTNGSGALGWYALASYSGTVTSVALADGSTAPLYNITGSPVTSAGTLTFTLATQAKNTVLAGPASGANAQPTIRALVNADLPINNIESAGWNTTTPAAILIALTVPQDILIPYNFTLNQVVVLTQGPLGSCTITLQRAAASAGAVANFPPAVDITNSNNVTCAAATATLTAANLASQGWTTALTQNDVIRCTLTANTGFTSVKIMLRFL